MRWRCKICDNDRDNIDYRIPEMMYGTRETFVYTKCGQCGCLQIREVPHDLSQYYPADYYSFEMNQRKPLQAIRNIKNCYAVRFAVFGKGFFGRLCYFSTPYLASLRMLHFSSLNTNSKILDVGCGAGTMVRLLRLAGFYDTLGIDPFINADIMDDNGRAMVMKQSLEKHSGRYNLIMFNHSFEHAESPFACLRECGRLLSRGGTIMLRIPVVDSWAWKHYCVHWAQIDAPRHIFLHSRCSIEKLANATDFKIKKIVYDSTAFQFWGSEQYAHDIPLKSDKSVAHGIKMSIFKKSDMRRFHREARRLNRESLGDQAAFFLQKA